ncbi:MAG TPA: peptidoglycan-binding protein, partial [Parvularculaceae bacterium]|nr:peptidoglycan-binding protein [Parvularculaceae bacterium]
MAIFSALRRALFGVTAAAAMTVALTGCGGAAGAKADNAPQTGFDIGYAAYASKQYEEAIDIWKRYAVAGDVRSQYILGEVYSNHPFTDRDDAQQKPEVVKVDLVEALKWYTLAANYDFDTRIRYEHVDVTADERNASILANQRLPQVRKLMSDSDVDKAEKLVSETFQRGSPYDLYRLGEMYEEGSGVDKDNVKALEMFILAQQRGVSQASAASAEVAKYMTKKDVDSAHDLATNWQPPLPVELTKPTKQQEENERLKRELEEIRLEDALKAVSDIDVELLQRSLRALGFYYGPIDNVMGDGTRAAIRRFQYSRVEKDDQMTDEEKEAVKTGVLSAHQTVD